MKRNILILAFSILGIVLAGAETLSLSYSEGKNASGAPMGIGTGDNMWIDMAIKIPGSTVRTLAGAQITGINGSCTSAADIERLHIWLRSDLEGENLAHFELIPNQLNNIKKGQNKLKFKTPWEIPADYEGDLYIGFGYKYVSGNARGLAVNTNPVPGGFYLLRADSLWHDYSHLGTACIEAIVEGDNLPKHNLQLSRVDFPQYFVQTRQQYTPTFVLHNFGTETVTSVDIEALFNNTIVEKKQVDIDVNSGMMEIFTLDFNPAITATGETTMAININPTDATDADPENNSITGTFITAPYEYNRRVLTEEFTTEMCGSCPQLAKWIGTELEKEEYNDVILVCHHAGYYTDFLTTDWDTEYLTLYGGGTFAPAVGVDRSIYTQNDVVIFPNPNETLAEWWTTRLATPALVSVDINVQQSAENENEIIVEVSGEKCIDKIAENPCVTVWLVEDNIPAQSQANGGKDYIHRHVNRAIQSDNYWGEPVTFDNNKYTYTCTFTLDEAWVRDNLEIVAFISENGSKYTEHEICNANKIDLNTGLNSINAVTANREVVNTVYYTITGQRITAPRNGIYICQKTYSDGTTETTKTIIR